MKGKHEKNLSWVWRVGRKISSSRSQSEQTRQASWWQTVILWWIFLSSRLTIDRSLCSAHLLEVFFLSSFFSGFMCCVCFVSVCFSSLLLTVGKQTHLCQRLTKPTIRPVWSAKPLINLYIHHICVSYHSKKVKEKTRECHNHKPQPFPDTKRKRKQTKPNQRKSNKRTKSTKTSALFSKRGNRNAKRTEQRKIKITQGKT